MITPTFGVNPSETIGLLQERASRWRRGQAFTDGRKIGLIVEGGAMRGVISCGALMGLEELGMTEIFDEVYGASAGAANAAYFLAGQAAYAATIYYQKINNTRFIRRLWHRQIVDIDSVFDSIVARERPLHVNKVLASRSQFFIVIADAGTGEAFLAKAQTSNAPLLTLLKASSAMPLLYNGVVNVNKRECFDGGLINPLPILDAIEAGCTDLLVLLTRPASFRESRPTKLEQRLFDIRCARGKTHLVTAFTNACVRTNDLRDIAFARQPVPSGINIVTICPDETDPRVERTTRSTEMLKAAVIASARRTLQTFGHTVHDFVEVLRPFSVLVGDSETEKVSAVREQTDEPPNLQLKIG
jgi:predicted patatin/cPLA2 family phospholipase